MKRKVLVSLVALLGIGLHAGEPAVPEAGFAPTAEVAAPAGEPAAIKDGYALLNSLLTLFENLLLEKKPAPGEEKVTKGGLALVDERLSQLGIDSKAALEAGLIDKIFFHRFRRLLMHYKLIITPVVRGDLLKDLFARAFDDFTWSVTYERWAWEDKDGIAKMAAAVEEEFVQLMIYLDTRQKRDELKKKIGMRMLPPPPPPPGKKKSEVKKPE
ncbi:MAG: hypothetical protein MUC72_07690 [Acidobacteria bacterium]|jgi:hypothetical protein|nr:hypothetical protein [Acidobacteriota bacterium]